MTWSLNSSALLSWPPVWMMVERVGPFSAPVAWLTLAAATALVRVSMPIWRVARATGSAWMRTAYLAEPNTPTWATPSMVEICRASRVSAYSSTSDGLSVDELIARNMMGMSAGFCLRKVGGCGRDLGRLRVAAEMPDCTSCAAPSRLRSRLNCSWIWVWPCVLLDVIWSMPAMVENWFSSGEATEDAMVSGSAPGRFTNTEM